MTKIYLLTDYRDQFYSSTKYRGAAVDLPKLKGEFAGLGYDLCIQSLSDINLRDKSYKGHYVLYQSSEDPGLYYKDYIEDVLLGLQLQGAVLIPEFKFFRAHHNKNFVEILRDLHKDDLIKNLRSYSFGTYEEYMKRRNSLSGSFVLKAGATSKSKCVARYNTNKSGDRIIKRFSRTFSIQNIKYYLATVRTGKKHLNISNYRRKFILQEFVDSLDGDYRVIVYGDKYYSLYRKNRKNDFRASGSMDFYPNFDVPNGFFDYAREIFESFEVPFISLDIGVKNGDFYLFEFQFVTFGQYTLEKSKHYHIFDGSTWNQIEEEPDLEREIAQSVAKHLVSK